jgi:hypothetical protein
MVYGKNSFVTVQYIFLNISDNIELTFPCAKRYLENIMLMRNN